MLLLLPAFTMVAPKESCYVHTHTKNTIPSPKGLLSVEVADCLNQE